MLWFDESYDERLYRLDSALAAAAAAAVLVTAGTSGATNLPDQMVRAAMRAGALLVDVNVDDGPAAAAAAASGGLCVRGPAAMGDARPGPPVARLGPPSTPAGAPDHVAQHVDLHLVRPPDVTPRPQGVAY